MGGVNKVSIYNTEIIYSFFVCEVGYENFQFTMIIDLFIPQLKNEK